MDGWKRVLIPLDGSDLSEWAIERTMGFLTTRPMQVTLLSVAEADEERASDLAYRVSPAHEELRRRLVRLRDAFEDQAVPAVGELRFGDPATEILREITAGNHDLVVMTTHGRTGLSRLLFGSVALKVLKASPVPLLLFRPLQRPDGSLSPVEATGAAPFRKILVPLDGSEAAEEILPAAHALAKATGAKLHLMRAVAGGGGELPRREQAEEYLRRWKARLSGQEVVVVSEVRTQPAGEAAIEAIREHGLDAVAMTTHGRTGLERVVYGSVAEQLLTDAEVPVLTFRNRAIREPLPPSLNEVRYSRV